MCVRERRPRGSAREVRANAAFSHALTRHLRRVVPKITTNRVIASRIVRNTDCKIVERATLRPPQLELSTKRKTMEIRFISSLTAEDEELFAPAVLKAASALLDQLPIAYTLRIETTGAQVYQHTHVMPDQRDEPIFDPRMLRGTAAT